MRNKIHFYATQFTNYKTGKKTMMFSNDRGQWLHWAGSNPLKPNFVLAKLIEKHGIEQGSYIYKEFNQALLEITDDTEEGIKGKKGCLVLYDNRKKFNEDDSGKGFRDVKEVDENIHSTE